MVVAAWEVFDTKKQAHKLLAFMLALAIVGVCTACGTVEIDVHIFSDMSECYALEQEQSSDVTVDVFSSPEDDKYLKDCTYTDFFACEYTSNDVNFTLFSYEFSDESIAQKYFQYATGQDADSTSTFSNSTGMFQHKSVVINGNFAYRLQTKASEEEKVKDFINERFSVELYYAVF